MRTIECEDVSAFENLEALFDQSMDGMLDPMNDTNFLEGPMGSNSQDNRSCIDHISL